MATVSVPTYADASRPDTEVIARATALVPLVKGNQNDQNH